LILPPDTYYLSTQPSQKPSYTIISIAIINTIKKK